MPDEDPANVPETPDAGGMKPEAPVSASRDQEATANPTNDLAEAIEPAPEPGAAEAYHQRARLAEDRLDEVLAAYRKLKKDNEGYRERTTRNIERRYELRRERLLLKFIEILDNLDRALDATEKTYAGEPLIEGLILVRTQLLQTLQGEGLDRIPVLGLPFDPSVSEAVGTQPVETPEMNEVVVKDVMRGYRLKGRVARASRVIIGEYRADAAPMAECASVIDDGAPQPDEAAIRNAAATAPGIGEPSLEDIIARAEAQDTETSATTNATPEPVKSDRDPDEE